MDRLFDLPAHPLLVHFPIVAIPTVAVAAVVLVARPATRSRYGAALLVLGVITTVSTFVAASSGEELREILDAGDYIDTHETLGNQLRWIMSVLTLTLIALVVSARRPSVPPALVNAVSLAVVLMAALALLWVVRTGHEGAKATWDGVLPAGDEVELAVSTDTTTTAEAATTEDSTTTESTTTESTTTEASTTTESTTTEASTTTESTTTESTTETSAAPPSGLAIYEAQCQRCHLADGSGSRGPSLIGIAADQPDPQEQIDQVTDGGRRMRAFGERLTTEEISAVVDYIRTTFV